MNRLANGYEPKFDIDAQVGRQGELLVLDTVAALANGASVEVKTDAKFADTGNVYFEYRCIGRPSGIATTQAEVWCVVLGDVVLAMPVDRLKSVLRDFWQHTPTYRRQCRRGSHPTEGMAVPLLVLLAAMTQEDHHTPTEAAA